jgi:hypothetical protein
VSHPHHPDPAEIVNADVRLLVEIATDHFAGARFCPSDEEVGEEYLALAFATRFPELSAAECLFLVRGPSTSAAESETVSNLNHAEPQRSPQPRRRRNPSITTLVKRAEKTGKTVTSITTPDGTTIHFGDSAPTEATNPWLAHLPKVRQ